MLTGKHEFTLDIHRNVYVSFTSKQYNSAEYLYVHVVDDGEEIEITNSFVIEIKVKTPDDRYIKLSTDDIYQRCKADDSNSILVNSSNISQFSPYIVDLKIGEYVRVGTSSLISVIDNMIVVHLPESLFLKPGHGVGEITLISDGRLSTMNFEPIIIASSYDEERVVDDAFSSDEVTQLKNTIQGYMSRAENASNAALQSELLSEEWAIGSSNLNQQPSATNNSKYYSTVSDKYSLLAKSYTIGNSNINTLYPSEYASRSNENTDNSKYYYEQSINNNLLSKSWAIGNAYKADGTDIRQNQDIDNSKYYSEQSNNYNKLSESWATGDAYNSDGSDIRVDQKTNNSKFYSSESKSWAIGDKADFTRNNGTGNVEQSSLYYAMLAHQWADGISNLTDIPSSTENAKYYAEKAKEYKDQAVSIAGGYYCTYDINTGFINDQYIKKITDKEIDDLFV